MTVVDLSGFCVAVALSFCALPADVAGHRSTGARHAVDTSGAIPGKMAYVAKIPDSTKYSLHQRLSARAQERWPALSEVRVRTRAGFAYVDGVLADGDVVRLCRLRYAGSARNWGFAIYRASHDDYEDSFLPTGFRGGTAEDALDTACGLYLNDPSAWI